VKTVVMHSVTNPEPKPEPETAKSKHPESHKLVLFHCHTDATFYGGIYDATARAFVDGYELAALPKRESRQHLCSQLGLKLPKDPGALPAGRFYFEPGNRQVLAKDPDGTYRVNTWREPPIRSEAIACTECPPTVRALLLHVVGDDTVSLERFLNWLAVAYQTNRPTGTAWIWSGTQGTGKGLVYQELLAALFGAKHCAQTIAERLADQFNSWLEPCVILNIDECEFSKGSARAALDQKLKVFVTGETLAIRAMHKAQREVRNYLNVILTSNAAVVADLPRGDRRFNVSPPQLRPLKDKYDTEGLVKALRGEVRAFAGFLEKYPADVQRARTAMESAAKDQMTEAAATGPDQFADALRSGDLRFFLDCYLDEIETVSQYPMHWARRQHFREALRAWLGAASLERNLPVPVGVLCDIYNVIFSTRVEMTSEGLGKFLSRRGLQSVRNTHGLRGRGYIVNWKAPERVDEYKAALSQEVFNSPAPEVIGATIAASAVTAADEVDLARGIDWLDGPETKQ